MMDSLQGTFQEKTRCTRRNPSSFDFASGLYAFRQFMCVNNKSNVLRDFNFSFILKSALNSRFFLMIRIFLKLILIKTKLQNKLHDETSIDVQSNKKHWNYFPGKSFLIFYVHSPVQWFVRLRQFSFFWRRKGRKAINTWHVDEFIMKMGTVWDRFIFCSMARGTW